MDRAVIDVKMREKEITFIDLFAGIGGCRIAFQNVGCKCVWSCDWDIDAQRVYEMNFGERPAGDIRKISSQEIPDHDILVAGFPCPSFSIIGERKGLSDNNGNLFFEIERILRDKKPEAFMLENVRDLKNHDKGRTLAIVLAHLRNLQYSVQWKILNALDFGLPQKRERIIIVGFMNNYRFEFPTGTKNRKELRDILEEDDKVDRRYWASEKIRENRRKSVKGKSVFYPSIWHENKGGDVGIHPYSCALRATASYNYLLVNGVRRPTPLEMIRLQGFPDDFKLTGSYAVIRKLLGNSVPIPMIQAAANMMWESIERGETAPTMKQAKLMEVL